MTLRIYVGKKLISSKEELHMTQRTLRLSVDDIDGRIDITQNRSRKEICRLNRNSQNLRNLKTVTTTALSEVFRKSISSNISQPTTEVGSYQKALLKTGKSGKGGPNTHSIINCLLWKT